MNEVERCPSTNDLAREAAMKGAEEGTVIVAAEQTRGRGTRGRSWYSVKNKGLYSSIILRPKESRLSLLPLLAGLAVREAVAEVLAIEVRLRWPNDILWEGKKVGGILCESGFVGDQLQYVIVGIGLNLHHEEEDFPEEIRPYATSLKLITDKVFDEALLRQALWKALNHWYTLFCQGQGERITRSFERSSFFSPGQKVTLLSDEGEVEGIYRGIDPLGGIVVEERGRRSSYFTAEVKKPTGNERRKKCS